MITTDRVRLYETVRTAHLERAAQLAPATILYRAERYDFHAEAARGVPLVRTSTLGAALLLLRSPIRSIEINEPLMTSSLPRSAAAIVALSLRRLVTGRRSTVVTYAIGNTDPFAGRARTPRGLVLRWRDNLLAHFVARRVDRIVYGTSVAEAVYRRRLPELHRAAQAVIPALPVARDVSVAKDADSVVFLGAFVERKGLPQLLDAWRRVAERVPEATLTIIGKGPLLPRVRSFSESTPGVTLLIDPERKEIFRQLDRAQVLVLPSQPTHRWKEQVGLPIVEGLASRCTIVTTSETGLSDWLRDNGHSVIHPPSDVAALADGIVDQLRRARPGSEIASSLPLRDGRLAADDWLFRTAEELR